MSWWNAFAFWRSEKQLVGLHPDAPVLVGGMVEGEFYYLSRLRCPGGSRVRFQRIGSVVRTSTKYLDGEGIDRRYVEKLIQRRGPIDVRELPLDLFEIECECGQHQERIYLDMYFAGPEQPIGKPGWTLAPGIRPTPPPETPCPYCRKPLRTPAAKQCRHCGMDWHDPQHVVQRGSGDRKP